MHTNADEHMHVLITNSNMKTDTLSYSLLSSCSPSFCSYVRLSPSPAAVMRSHDLFLSIPPTLTLLFILCPPPAPPPPSCRSFYLCIFSPVLSPCPPFGPPLSLSLSPSLSVKLCSLSFYIFLCPPFSLQCSLFVGCNGGSG